MEDNAHKIPITTTKPPNLETDQKKLGSTWKNKINKKSIILLFSGYLEEFNITCCYSSW
jgi:hypothetical protein